MYIQREIREKFEKLSKAYPIVALVGARQSGKTTFLKEESKKMNSSYLLFDDPDIREMFEEDVKKFENQYITGKEVSVLDEVQNCKDAGQNLKYLADTGRKLWVTSSSEAALSKEVLSYLVGRVSILKLYPFSIKEFLELKGYKELTEKILRRVVEEHILYGGYPRAALTEDIELKKTILKDLYETMVLKDIARTFSIENLKSLEEFSKYLALNIGGMISYERISNDLNLSFQTIKKYLDAMDKSYLVIRISPFFKNRMKEITKQPKIYFLDTGLRNAISGKFNSEIDGNLFENYVLSELIKMGCTPKYWRTKNNAEVDFIVEKDSEIIPIEIKLSSSLGKIERSLRSFIKEYRPKRAFIITLKAKEGEIKANGTRVIFTNILGLKDKLSKL